MFPFRNAECVYAYYNFFFFFSIFVFQCIIFRPLHRRNDVYLPSFSIYARKLFLHHHHHEYTRSRESHIHVACSCGMCVSNMSRKLDILKLMNTGRSVSEKDIGSAKRMVFAFLWKILPIFQWIFEYFLEFINFIL